MQILKFLDQLSVPDHIHAWALKKLGSAFADKRADTEAQRFSLEKAVAENERALNNLTTLRLRDLLSDSEFVTRRENLQMEQFKVKEALQNCTQVASAFEPAQMVIKFNNRAISWFNEGDVQIKRLILEIASSNLLLKDKKLLIEAAKPFILGPKTSSISTLSTLVEDVRTRQFDDDFAAMIYKLKMLFERIENGEGLKSAA